jgi:hypothetical protein
VAGALAAIALLVAVYQSGVNAERKRGEAATLRAELRIKEADLEAAKRAGEIAKQFADEMERSASESAGALDALEQELSKRPAGSVPRVSPADAQWLRNFGRPRN